MVEIGRGSNIAPTDTTLLVVSRPTAQVIVSARLAVLLLAKPHERNSMKDVWDVVQPKDEWEMQYAHLKFLAIRMNQVFGKQINVKQVTKS